MISDLEFGRPKTSTQAIIRLPDRKDPEYKTDTSHEHLAHFKNFVIEFFIEWKRGSVPVNLDERSVPLSVEDMQLLFQTNSFFRELKSSTVIEWECLYDDETAWSALYDQGDEAYRWWQISALNPDLVFGEYRMWCIETNKEFQYPDKGFRFDERSEFELVFATQAEIDELTNLLKRNNH